MNLGDVAAVLEAKQGVRSRVDGGRTEWRYHGRLVARALDATAIVIRCELEVRASLLKRHPGTFSVPAQYERHMMVVADLESGDEGAIEEALTAAWALQRRGA